MMCVSVCRAEFSSLKSRTCVAGDGWSRVRGAMRTWEMGFGFLAATATPGSNIEGADKTKGIYSSTMALVHSILGFLSK